MAPKLDRLNASKKSRRFRRQDAMKITESNSTSQTTQQCDEPSSSSYTDSAKSIIKKINEDTVAIEGENGDVNLQKLEEHINRLLELKTEENRLHQKLSTGIKWPWPNSLELKKLKDFLQCGIDFASALKDIISGPVKDILKEIGHASLATTGLLVVAYSLERYEELSSNKNECLNLLNEMSSMANLVKDFKESSKGLHNAIQDATTLIVEGAIICCSQIDSSSWKRFLKSSNNKEQLSNLTKKLDRMYLKINVQIGRSILDVSQRKGKSPLSKGYPTHAVGIDKSIIEVLDLLECESDKNAVTVILHGFGGMGKTTLADAVFSLQDRGCQYSHVRLFNDIDSHPDIVKLQILILKDLMGPEATIPDIRSRENGQRELEDVLRKVDAFIYIDNVLNSTDLTQLLPENMDQAKKVRILLTARDVEDLPYACPTRPKIYRMKGIETRHAMSMLMKHIKKEEITENQFKDIVEICGGSLICFLTGMDEEDICSIREELRDVIQIIHIDSKRKRFNLTDNIYKDYFCLLDKTTEMEGMSPDLWGHEAMRFWIRSFHMNEEINEMDDSDGQLCDLKSLLHFFQPKKEYHEDKSMILIGENGKRIVASCRGRITNWLFREGRNDRTQRLVKRMVKDYKGGNQTRDGDSNISDSLTNNIQTTAAAVEQEYLEVDLDSLSEYISELLEVEQLFHLFKFNKERKKRPQPKVIWPTSKGFSNLQNFLSKGAEASWVKDVILRHDEPYKVFKTCITSLLEGIGEADWAAAGLLVIAEILQSAETVLADQNEYLLALDEMFRLVQYIKQFNQKPGVWTQMKRAATGIVLMCSLIYCAELDPSKFTLFDKLYSIRLFQHMLEQRCDIMANAVAEGLDNEDGSVLLEMCAGFEFLLEPESEDEGGPSPAKASSMRQQPPMFRSNIWGDNFH